VIFGLDRASVDALGLALLHFAWQGAALALALRAFLGLAHSAGPRLRHGAASLTLLAMLAAPVVTVFVSLRAGAFADVDETVAVDTGMPGAHERAPGEWLEPVMLPVAGSAGDRFQAVWEPALPALVLAWCCGVFALAGRFAGGALRARRLTRADARPAAAPWQDALTRLARRMGVRRPVRLVISGLVTSPATLGWVKPVVLVPASVFVGLTPVQLEAVLAHEVAHVRRYDFLVNLLQVAAETLLFYHPAVWWVSRVISRERELVCDDLAVSACGDALVYARALARLERLRGAPPRLALAAHGGEFYDRVLRLVEPAGPPRSRRRARPALALAAAGLVALAGAQALRLAPSAASRPTPAAAQFAEVLWRIPDGSGAGFEAVWQDPTVRSAAEDALGGRHGCAVVVDARDGRVLAVVHEEWAAKRAWPAASTFKLVTSLAALSEGLADPERRVRVADAPVPLDLESALARSSNAYFERLGARVGSALLEDYARRLGLGERTSPSLAGEIAGSLPGRRANAAAFGGLGSGVFVTPLQLARLVGTIACGGERFDLSIDPAAADGARGVERTIEISAGAFRWVRDGMRACASRGTAAGVFGDGTPVAGKTGTARGDGCDVGMFACFAPANAPRWIVVVALDERGATGATAAEAAASILRRLGVS
jgi:beta-lactamase regulating signal transducer with metallopeptidase domain